MNDEGLRCFRAPHRMSTEGSQQMVKIAIAGLIGAFVIFYMMTSPDQAAAFAKGVGHLATDVAHGVGDFLDRLAA